MRVLIVQPGRPPAAKEIGEGLSAIQGVVGGPVQAVYPFEEPVALICHEEGKLLGLPLYHQAEEALRRCWAPSSPDGLYSEFCRTLNRRLREAQEALIPMRTQRTAPVLNRISSLLTPDKVTGELETASASQRDSFALNCASHYLSHTEYAAYGASEGEPGITWLLGKLLIRHGYDLSPAISSLKEDLRRTVTDCRKAFCVQAEQAIQRHILVPLNPLLPILYQLLDTQNS